MMMRVHWGMAVLALAVQAPALHATPPAVAAVLAIERPNVVLIIADDLDTATFNRGVSLGLFPNITALAVRGSVFTNAFVTNAVCCPARVTLLTGQYSHNHGVRTIHPPTGGISAFDDRSTLAVWLKQGGYRTGHVGKYLNGYGSADANRDGVRDEHDIRYIPPGWDDWQSLFEPSSSWMYHYAVNDNGVFSVYGAGEPDYQTDVLADRAADFIVESAQLPSSTPFFLSVSPSVPHMEVAPDIKAGTYPDAWPWTVRPAPRHIGTVNRPLDLIPSLNEIDVSDKPEWVQQLPVLTAQDREYLRIKSQSRLAALRAFDDLVGTLVETLRVTGELDNTFVVLTSDNGYHLGEHRLTEKLTAYEESIRVPLIVAGPGVPSQLLRQMVTNTDIAPTIVDVANVQPGLPADGLSMRPVVGISRRHMAAAFPD